MGRYVNENLNHNNREIRSTMRKLTLGGKKATEQPPYHFDQEAIETSLYLDDGVKTALTTGRGRVYEVETRPSGGRVVQFIVVEGGKLGDDRGVPPSLLGIGGAIAASPQQAL